MSSSGTIPTQQSSAVASPLRTSLKVLALSNGVILVAIAWLLDFWVLPPLYVSLAHAEVEAFAIGYVLLFYLTPVGLVLGTLVGFWLTRRMLVHATPKQLFVKTWAVQLATWIVTLVTTFPAEIGGALKGT